MNEMNESNTSSSNEQDSPESPPNGISNKQQDIVSPHFPVVVDTMYSRYPMGVLTPELLRPLVIADPSGFLKIAKDFLEDQNETRKMTMENQHALNMKQEENRLKASMATKSSWQFAMGTFTALFVCVLVYAYIAGDKSLPDRIIQLMTGALAGGGGATLLNQKSKKDKE